MANVDARQMAAAPKAEKEAKFNRYMGGDGKPGLFTSIVFKPASASAKVYDEGDEKTRKIANVLIELGGTGFYLKGSIKAVQGKGDKSPHARFGFFGAVNQGQCVVTEDSQADADLIVAKGEITKRFGEWYKSNGAAKAEPSAEAVVLDSITL